ncbi:hypothetical protein [Rothia sp. ZJ1223]|uniref:hypothetical protein n=1 Tax=Rothia sp. ZJ1223 TaxID=2811098 RepID=UPI001EF52F22|nr:hypothetical protein [Rothia sp. ZJ1223]
MSEFSRRDSNDRRSDNRRDGFKNRGDRNFSGDRSSSDNRREGGRSFGGNRRDDDRRGGERSFGNDGVKGRRFNNERTNHNEDKRFGGRRRGGEGNNARRSNDEGGYTPPAKVAGPEIDTDVTGKELDGSTLRQLRALEAQNAETVAQHLVMAGRYLEIDPAFALEHAKYATRRAGRIAVVREATGIAAYVAEDFELSLRELRTHRRITGSNEHVALLVDNERALGKTEKALELAAEVMNEDLAPVTRVEVALVVSGIKHDAGDLGGALKALEIPELNKKRGFEYSPRLFSAYSELLSEAGRTKEAKGWMRLAVMTEAALGQGAFVEPEIFDIFSEQDLLEPEEPSVDLTAEATDDADEESEITEENEENLTEASATESSEQLAPEEVATVEEEPATYNDENAAEDHLSVVDTEQNVEDSETSDEN